MPRPGKNHPDYDAIGRRAFNWAKAAGWLTQKQIDEALEAGENGLRNERLLAEKARP